MDERAEGWMENDKKQRKDQEGRLTVDPGWALSVGLAAWGRQDGLWQVSGERDDAHSPPSFLFVPTLLLPSQPVSACRDDGVACPVASPRLSSPSIPLSHPGCPALSPLASLGCVRVALSRSKEESFSHGHSICQ